MTKTVKEAKKRILEALNAIDAPESECAIQVTKADEKVFREALNLFEVKVKIKEKNTKVNLLVSTPETLRLMIELRVLCLSLIIATEHLGKATYVPQEAWLKLLSGMAIERIKESEEQAANAVQVLKLIGIDEADFVKAIIS